jgi:outer membrane protein OmpA-like peptidoglycan-associated protein
VKVSGTSNTAQVDTHDLQPGSYAVTGHVTEGKKPGQFADCTASITVKQFEPPTVSCTASPTTVNPGDSSTVTAQGVSPQNRPLTYSYSASAGQISGTGSSATLSTTGAPAGAVTVTCNVQDDKGQTASATTTVSINAPPPPPAPKTQAQCSISFDRDKRRPARVDNEAKACLDQFVLSLKNQSNASAVVVGEATQDEMNPPKHRGRHAKAPANLAAQRAVNAKDYLVTEGGIETSRISVRTGTQGNKEVENYLVPSGANFDSDVSGTTAVDESTVKAQPRKPLATRTHHHHRKATKVGSHSTNPQSQ